MSAKRIKLSGSEYRKKAIEKNKKNKDVIEQCQKLDSFFKKTSPLNIEIESVNTQTIINVDESVDNSIVQSCDKTDSLLENVVENNCLKGNSSNYDKSLFESSVTIPSSDPAEWNLTSPEIINYLLKNPPFEIRDHIDF
ncbi:uncharacterized protein LOC112685732 isoform X2 [Sipha flava]|uniref:Uncharacterized protein LOC112685732 isoform X2 n=1 Tax=Sipha flava TaxID=143950 RepID=A0A8B8FRA3_9HEMI|nr:uncharacterized protein LOC112685732 isoform X2 [Sipha flava]